jgi:hypothetical protein
MAEDKATSYHGNPNLKKIGHQHEFTTEQISEIAKCTTDPIYFIETWCKIVSLDRGLVPFKLYECQKRKIKTILGNRKVVCMEPRQNGKCLKDSTRINIRSKTDGRIHNVRIGDFYEWQQFCRWAQEFGPNPIQAPSGLN